MSENVEAKSAPKPPAGAGPAMLEGGVAEAVIGGALVGVLEDLVGLVDFLEAMLAALVARIAIGMPLHGELAERGLELRIVGGALDPEDFVVAALGHAPASPHFTAAASRTACHRQLPARSTFAGTMDVSEARQSRSPQDPRKHPHLRVEPAG